MWLDRFSGQNTPSASPVPWNRNGSPAPGRSSLHINRNSPLQRRPELPQRVSSWSGLVNGSTESLPASARELPRSSLRNQLNSGSGRATNPLEVLHGILDSSEQSLDAQEQERRSFELDAADIDIDFKGHSLQDYVRKGSSRTEEVNGSM